MTSPAIAEAVGRHFDAEAARFDAIYRTDKGLMQRCIDALFRGVIKQRFELILDWCAEVTDRRILDAGCGSGRYCVELAHRGAQVTGIDLAEAMVAMSRQAASQAGVDDSCDFAVADVFTWCAPHDFDITLGIGFFDYIADPARMLARLREVTAGRGMFSFPIRWRVRTPTRWLRLRLRGCPVYFYDRSQVEQLLADAGWEDVQITQLSRDYLVNAGSGRASTHNESQTLERE
ncbi:MAG: methyltransferase domain-containing protein [bacterium]|nr:methyltransferase domain-containing protein [bacterium]